jgi:hypothetical protein
MDTYKCAGLYSLSIYPSPGSAFEISLKILFDVSARPKILIVPGFTPSMVVDGGSLKVLFVICIGTLLNSRVSPFWFALIATLPTLILFILAYT